MSRERREIVVRLAWSLLWRPYRWGGDDPGLGFDCSGLCVELLKSVGVLPRGYDGTAQALWDLFSVRKALAEPGDLVFYHAAGDEERIVHVEVAVDGDRSIGASGGGRTTVSEADAWRQNAYIKLRPIRRPGFRLAANPYVYRTGEVL